MIKDCFVTGKWKSSEDADELLRLDNLSDHGDSDDDVYGDFEDYETGEKHVQKNNGAKSVISGDEGDEKGNETKWKWKTNSLSS